MDKLMIMFTILVGVLMSATAVASLDGFQSTSPANEVFLQNAYVEKDPWGEVFDDGEPRESDELLASSANHSVAFTRDKFSEYEKIQVLFDGNVKLTHDFFVDREKGATIIANYISNGLVSQGEHVKDEIIYFYINIAEERTKEIFAKDDKDVYEKLTPGQRVELFVNMLCDIVLLNPDVYSEHFGITQDGILISFNKERAYSGMLEDKDAIKFDASSMLDDFFARSKVYKYFIQELKNHPEELKSLLNDPYVKGAFLRISAITSLLKERECVRQILSPLFTFIKKRSGDDKAAEKFDNEYFKMLGNISDYLAKKLDAEECFAKEEVVVSDVGGMKMVVFDPKVNKLHLIAAKEVGFPDGARVEEIARKTNMLVAMNAGFFNEGGRASSAVGRWWGRLCTKAYQYTAGAVEIGTNYAYPTSIQKVNKGLLSDTGNYLPALGVSDSGDIKMGEVKVVWIAKLSENGRKIKLDRASDININTTDATIYYKDGSDTKEVVISNGKVLSIKTVAEVAKKSFNGYWLHDPSEETIDEFKSLNIGDYLSYGYEFEAAVYAEQSKNVTIDVESSSFFNSCSYVVSGGQLLMRNGEVDSRISRDYGRAIDANGEIKAYENFGTAVCLRKDGMASFIVKEGDLSRDDFVDRLKEEGCESAISLDGGGSTTLIAKEVHGFHGFNRVISDIVAVMPRYSDVLLLEKIASSATRDVKFAAI